MTRRESTASLFSSWRESLQFRLAWRLALLYVGVTVAIFGSLLYRTLQTADSINDHDLTDQATALARAVAIDERGMPRLTLPPALAATYRQPAGGDVFAIRNAEGQLIAASPAGFGERVSTWTKVASAAPRYFRLKDIGEIQGDYYGLCVLRPSAAGPLSIAVARPNGASALVDALLREFMIDVAWMIPLLLLVTLGIGVLAIRSGLKTVRNTSQLAASIGPQATSVRLPKNGLPSEVLPLVVAVNQALDRLEKGFIVQREFTANAAHELRTPLAILTGALDGNGELTKIRADVARMNRLVEQLLRVARLDAIALDLSERVDLNDAARSVVAAMAPWALTQNVSLGVTASDATIVVRGNGHAIADALRNLVENAVAHAPGGTEVAVTVLADRCLTVADQGRGIATADRERIFDRFWRGKERLGDGAGLGLAIVREIMQSHGGRVGVTENPGGGALFTLTFPTPG
ncbi:MAG: sensor histidine kinase N-terminal domain-containing protein [Betaproteobacteria bacterium]|nr:sensor histidine kinase N-terminal domain-containing protein [Betaproteobacteria bacterium]